jgi:hypothetical protein
MIPVGMQDGAADMADADRSEYAIVGSVKAICAANRDGKVFAIEKTG